MPESQDGFPWWMAIVGVIVILILIDGCPQDSADTELARATREAVELARDAQTQDRSAVIWTGRFRMLGLILGVSVPIVVAYLIWRSSCKGEIDPIEVLAELERHSLPGPVGPSVNATCPSIQSPSMRQPPRNETTHSPTRTNS